MDVCETKDTGLFNKVHIFEPIKVHIYESNIGLIRLFSVMFNYAKPRMITDQVCMIPTKKDTIRDESNSRNFYLLQSMSVLHG